VANEDLEAKDAQKVQDAMAPPPEENPNQNPSGPPPAQPQSAMQHFNEEPFIVAVNALLAKLDVEPKIGWDVEWQAVRRELKALYAEME
jgi:hypothetical protein